MVTKHPLLRPAIALTLGIIFASQCPIVWSIGFAGAALFAVSALAAKTKHDVFAFGFWLFLGASLLSFRMDERHPTDLRKIFGTEPEIVTVRGTLNVDPERRVLEQDHRTRYRTTARVSVVELQRRDQWQPASGDLAVSTTGFTPDEFVADANVEITGVISQPSGPIAPGLFDFERYLKWQRIFFVLRAESTNDWKLLALNTGWSAATFYRKFNDWARRTLQRGIPVDENTRLLWAMALGWRPGLTNEISEPFMRTGTLHIFAISGLHIAMIAAMLVKFLRLVRVSRNWAGAIAIPIIWFYTAATGWQASAIRSTIMCTVIIVGWLLKRPNNLLNSLAASAVIILLWQAEQLFQPGFQLSFILLLSLALWPGLSPHSPWPDPTRYLGQADEEEFARKADLNRWTYFLARIFEKLTGRDPMLPSDLRPPWRRGSDRAIIWLLNGLNISLASLVGSIPVIALYFNLISFSSLVANLIIVPVSGITLAAALASLVLAPIPYLPELANWISWWTMAFMVWFCRWLEHFHWTYNYVQAPTALSIIAYYATIIFLLKGWLRHMVAQAAIASLILIAISWSVWTQATQTRITALPGSGVIFIDAPWSKNDLLVDCGRDREAATIVKPFLHSRGVNRLPAILLTHGDITRIEGYSRLAADFDPAITYTSPARSRSPKYRAILRSLEQTPSRWKKVSAGDELAGWKVLHPAPNEDFPRADDEAIVLHARVENHTITLLSDLGRLGQQSLLASGRATHTEIIFGGVPTDGEIARNHLTETLRPKIFILTGNDAKAQRAFRELRSRGIHVLPTASERAITVTLHRGAATIESMTGTRLELR